MGQIYNLYSLRRLGFRLKIVYFYRKEIDLYQGIPGFTHYKNNIFRKLSIKAKRLKEIVMKYLKFISLSIFCVICLNFKTVDKPF